MNLDKKNNTSMVLQLREWPAILNKHEVGRLTGHDGGGLDLMLHRWTQREWVRQAGPRTGLYYNLVADPKWETHVAEAVLRKYPSATLAGPSVLHAHGCQTQIPSDLWVAVLKRRSRVQMDGVQWLERDRGWFEANRSTSSLYGLPSLSPRQALDDGLAEAIANPKTAWVPDMDDIDMDEVDSISEAMKSVVTPTATPRRRGP